MRLLILISITLFFTSPLTVYSQGCRETFKSLRENEFLSYEIKYDSASKKSSISFFRENGKIRLDEITTFTDLSCNNVYLCKNRTIAFILAEGILDQKKVDEVWILDGVKGYAEPLIESNCSFVVSDSADFICYEYRKNITEVEWASGNGKTILSIPIIRIFNVSTKIITEYDFEDSFLKDQWGIGAQIEYVPELSFFNIEFYIEDHVVGKGHIELSDLAFHLDE